LRVKEVKMKMKDKIFRKFLPPVVVALVAMLLLCAVPVLGNTVQTTDITGTIVPRKIAGEVHEVDCAVLAGVNVTVYQGAVEITNTIGNGTGNYEVEVPALGDYNVTISKVGFRNIMTQAISVPAFTTYTLDFAGDFGLIPNAPDMSYVLACINLWKFGTPPCQLGMSTVLAVINAWKNPAP
jgi:hypothetical protein